MKRNPKWTSLNDQMATPLSALSLAGLSKWDLTGKWKSDKNEKNQEKKKVGEQWPKEQCRHHFASVSLSQLFLSATLSLESSRKRQTEKWNILSFEILIFFFFFPFHFFYILFLF